MKPNFFTRYQQPAKEINGTAYTFAQYEGEIFDEVEELLQCDRSDAQAIARDELVDDCWNDGLTPQKAAQQIAKVTHVRDAPDPEERYWKNAQTWNERYADSDNDGQED